MTPSHHASINDPNVQAIRESFGRVVYSHKTHEKAREIESSKVTTVKWANIEGYSQGLGNS